MNAPERRPDSATPHAMRLVVLSTVGCAAVLICAAIVLAGYCSGSLDLIRLVPGQVSVQSSTAVFLLFLAVSSLLVYRASDGQAFGVEGDYEGGMGWTRRALQVFGQVLAYVVCACAIATFIEDVSGADYGLNHTWWRVSDDSAGLTFPGPLSPTLAISFFLLGLAFALPRKFAERFQIDRLLLAVVALLAAFPFFSLSCGIPVICDIRSCVRVAPVTGALSLVLCLSSLLAKPGKGAVSILCRDTTSGAVARSLIAFIISLFPILQLRGFAVSSQLCNEPTGWWVSGIVMLIISGLMVFRINKRIHAEAERSRELFEERLRQATSSLQAQSQLSRSSTLKLKSVCLDCGKDFQDPELTHCPFDGSNLAQIMDDDLVGTVFDNKYLIESKLGEGGMSTVFKAKHLLLQSTLAIKVLQAYLQTDKNSVMRFQQEAKATSSLSHRNIIGVRDFGITPNGQAFIVMDYIDGQSLSEILGDHGALSIQQSIELYLQICEGLKCAHENGIVHRDLKPSNIMLIGNPPDYLVKIVDFGLAKILASDLKLTATGDITGSPMYMSPEQCCGMPQDERSDIYSLACMMYECLSGFPPFNADSVYDVMRQHAHDPANGFDPELRLPHWLEAIIMESLEKRPEHRPQSIAAIQAQLMEHARSYERT